MDHDKNQAPTGEQCRGVIKKLFPAKRYGFAVCECEKHTGEAHFNYSDLQIPDPEIECLIVGWRIEFIVTEQTKKTDHCDYRATQVKPFSVMVVQCDFYSIHNDVAHLTCRELPGKIIFVTKDKYNGKFEAEAVNRHDTCRAAVTWQELMTNQPFANHCSQDVPATGHVPAYGRKQPHKTPEKRQRRDTATYNKNDAEVTPIRNQSFMANSPRSSFDFSSPAVLSANAATRYNYRHSSTPKHNETEKKNMHVPITSISGSTEAIGKRNSLRRNLMTEFSSEEAERLQSTLPEESSFLMSEAGSRADHDLSIQRFIGNSTWEPKSFLDSPSRSLGHYDTNKLLPHSYWAPPSPSIEADDLNLTWPLPKDLDYDDFLHY